MEQPPDHWLDRWPHQAPLVRGEDDPNRRIHLFVRKEGKTRAGTATPFTYCGRLECNCWEGEKPITVWWRLTQALSPSAWSQFTPS